MAVEPQQHVAKERYGNNSALTLCGKLVPFGKWKAGAAYEGLRIVGLGPEDFCPECSREWLRKKNTVSPDTSSGE